MGDRRPPPSVPPDPGPDGARRAREAATPLATVTGRPPLGAAGPVTDPDAGAQDPQDWVVMAQTGAHAEVLALTRPDQLGWRDLDDRVVGMYARCLALSVQGETASAVVTARELVALCREEGLAAAGLRSRALLVELLRRSGDVEESLEQLARAVAGEPGLRDIADRQVQSALGALAVALRLSGLTEEARRVESRLDPVEALLPTPQRVSRLSNLAMAHAVQALRAGSYQSQEVDHDLLRRAQGEVDLAAALDDGQGYDQISEEARVLRAVSAAVGPDPQAALAPLQEARTVLEVYGEAVTAQLLWGFGWVRALRRLGRTQEAAAAGRDVLAQIPGSGEDGDRLLLAHEVLAAEQPGFGPGSGMATVLSLYEQQHQRDGQLLRALFRSRVEILRDADERRLLARAASLDSLTGLVNRRAAAAVLAAAAIRPGPEPVSLLLLDLDGFRRYNDAAGHLAGDVALQHVASAVRRVARSEDVVARWGGDEFIIVARVGPEQAQALGDRLREVVHEATSAEGWDRVTASVGIAVRTVPIDEQEWLHHADVALYTARRRGGDSTVLA